MDQIQHTHVDARGVKLHIAEIGTGSSVVLFLHGFPEIWYSWRYQMIAIADAGYRAIAPDFRGYGLSEHHPEPEKASFNDFVVDTIAILDYFHIDKVYTLDDSCSYNSCYYIKSYLKPSCLMTGFLIGKDFGSWPVYLLSLLHPTRILGVVSLGVPFFVPRPQRYRDLPEGFYISRWKEPGRAEADFRRFDVKTVWRNIYILFSRSEIPVAEKDKEIMDLVDPSNPLPAWLNDEDFTIYAKAYENSGFSSPMRVPYKRLPEEFTIENPKVEVPVLLIVGGKDYFLKFPGIEDYVTSGKVKDYVADLEIEFLPDGTHFMQEQFPDRVNQAMINFLDRHVGSST